MSRPPPNNSASSSSQGGSASACIPFFAGLISPKSVSIERKSEVPIGILHVQVASCRDLPAYRFSPWPNPVVVITFGNQRVKTPVAEANRGPKYRVKTATFDLPVFASVIETHGALLEFVVWNESLLGKDYFAECCLPPSEWFERKNGENDAPVYAFDNAGSNPLSFSLHSEPRAPLHSKQPTIQVKIGLVSLDSKTQNLPSIYEKILSTASKATNKLLSLPPLQPVGALRPGPNPHVLGLGPHTFSKTATTSKNPFRTNWDDAYIDYDLASNNIAGIVLLEILGANGLPRAPESTRTGFNMDPCIVIKYNDELYRTKVVRGEMNPPFNDRFILFVRRSAGFSRAVCATPGIESSIVILSVLNWGDLSKNKHIGTAVLNLQSLIDAAPRPDPETGLYSPEAMQLHAFPKVDLEVGLAQPGIWRIEQPPTIRISAKYEPSAAMRQRYWRLKLRDFENDRRTQLSHAELLEALEESGLPVSTEHVDRFFKELKRDPELDNLTIDEVMIYFEKEYAAVPEINAEDKTAVASELTKGKSRADNGVNDDLPADADDVSSAPAKPTASVSEDLTPSTPLEVTAFSSRMPRPLPASLRKESSSSYLGSKAQSDGGDTSPLGRHETPSNSLTPTRLTPFTLPRQPHDSDSSLPREPPSSSTRLHSMPAHPGDGNLPPTSVPNRSLSFDVGQLASSFKHMTTESGPDAAGLDGAYSSDFSDSESDSSGTVEDVGDMNSNTPTSSHISQLLNIEQHLICSLQGREAAETGSKLHSYLKSCPANSSEYSSALRLLQNLCSSSGELPSAFQLNGVTFDRGDVVGRGGEATVYAGYFSHQKVVVREVVRPQIFWRSPEGKHMIKLIHREAITHSLLDHPNIIPFLGTYTGHTDAPPMVILPFIEKGSLGNLLQERVIQGVEFARIVTGIGRALSYLHSRNPQIFHGDLHPGNILIGPFGNALLCDFGLSRIRHEVTRSQTNIREGGRKRFLAPELSAGAEKFRTSAASDIFSLSMTLLNVWTRDFPFAEIYKEQKAEAAIRKGRRPGRPAVQINLPSNVEQEFWLLLVDMWTHDASSRPPSEDVQKRLETIFGPLLLAE